MLNEKEKSLLNGEEIENKEIDLQADSPATASPEADTLPSVELNSADPADPSSAVESVSAADSDKPAAELDAEQGTGGPETASENPETHPEPDAVPEARKKRMPKAAKIALAVVVALLVLLIGAGVVVMEPWVKPEIDDYTGPATQQLEAVSLSVGEIFDVEVPLSENEEIKKISVADADILQLEGEAVTALGEYFSTSISVTTQEIAVPERELKPFSVFGKDLTVPYNQLRDTLRDWFGIEPVQEPRTELRELNVFDIPVSVEGYADRITEEDTVKAFTEESGTLPIELEEGEAAIFTSDDPAVVTVQENDDGEFVIEAVSEGETKINGIVGFWKSVDEQTYADYLAATGKEADERHLNEIFVAQRGVVYPVEITQKPVSVKPSTGTFGSSGASAPTAGGSSSGSSGSSGSSSGGSSGGSSGLTFLSADQVASIVAAGNAALGDRYWEGANYYDASCNVLTVNKSYDQVYQEVMNLVAITYPVGRVFNIGDTIIVAYSY